MSVWDDVAGQPEVVAQLRGAAEDPTAMTHAWLFTGPPGSGRSTAARAFAAALQCERAGEPGCGSCHACRTVLAGTHADVQVVATEKLSIGVDDVRVLVQRAARRPSSGPWRVVLVEDADRFTEQSANTLLKSIEEPPPRTVWLLCAPSPEDMVTTRCACGCRRSTTSPRSWCAATGSTRRWRLTRRAPRRATSASRGAWRVTRERGCGAGRCCSWRSR